MKDVLAGAAVADVSLLIIDTSCMLVFGLLCDAERTGIAIGGGSTTGGAAAAGAAATDAGRLIVGPGCTPPAGAGGACAVDDARRACAEGCAGAAAAAAADVCVLEIEPVEACFGSGGQNCGNEAMDCCCKRADRRTWLWLWLRV